MTPEADRMLNPERPAERLEEKAARLALLTPPGPALTLHQAAERLRTWAAEARAEMARNDYWSGGWAAGVQGAISDGAGFLATMCDPDMADDLADFLDATAVAAVRHAAGGCGNIQEEITDGYPIRTAQRILEASSRG